ncbi:hypothetical protein TL16_g08342 [Triparma laevis f. inornata]|uniref:cholesterol 7-desaturase n=1 Tax=Triparma laevis f. inornata TaxID=1714386 RepID=A0A9W7EJ98_9STRA|nr:hypothetical protein TL16_g08342 [Triparma laevis f. inornata]
MSSDSSSVLVGLCAVLLSLLYFKTTTAPQTHKVAAHNHNSSRYKALRRKNFPPPFPNGWFHVANLPDVQHGKVKSISALGMDLVCFKGSDSGEISILDAHCPHLGAHLGEGGVVVGDHLKCPFHGWEFDTSGNVKKIPYSSSKTIPSKCKTRTHHTRVILDSIWLWHDAEGRPPLYELKEMNDVIKKGLTLRVVKQNTFDQHIAEMCENSADPYHFQTLHGPLPILGLKKVVGCRHTITQKYPDKENNDDMHTCKFTEQMSDLELLGGVISFRKWVPFAAPILDSIFTSVVFEGPGNISFSIRTPLGEMRMFMTNLPLEPFKQYVENHWIGRFGRTKCTGIK